MSVEHAAQAVSRLIGAYGSDITQERAAIYVERLSDIEPELLGKAVNEILDKQKFFPAISEVRQAAGGLARLTCALPPAANEIIRQADVRRPVYRRDGSFAYTERVWEWPEMNAATREAVEAALAQVGEPCDEIGEARFGWEMGFQKVYEVEAQAVNAKVLADLSFARLPAPKPQTALPAPPVKEWQPSPEDEPIPMCDFCGKHFGFGEKDGKKICLHCQLEPAGR